MIFYIESNGFCATHWLTRAFNNHDRFACVHGTRSLPEPAPLGAATDLTPAEFARRLEQIGEARGRISGAIHGKFGPQMRTEIKRQGGYYALAVRHPVTRVNSCRAWTIKTIESGKRIDTSVAMAICTKLLRSNFGPNEVALAFACLHTFDYDISTLSPAFRFDEIVRMEDYTTDPEYLAGLLSRASGHTLSPDPIWAADQIRLPAMTPHSNSGGATAENTWSKWTEAERAIFTWMFRQNARRLAPAYTPLGYTVDV